MIDLGIVRQEKDKVIPANSQLGKVSPGMALLLKDYLLKRSIEENKNDFYYILGREVWDIFYNTFVAFLKDIWILFIWIKNRKVRDYNLVASTGSGLPCPRPVSSAPT